MVETGQDHRLLDEALPRLCGNSQQIDRFQSVVFMGFSIITESTQIGTDRLQPEHYR